MNSSYFNGKKLEKKTSSIQFKALPIALILCYSDALMPLDCSTFQTKPQHKIGDGSEKRTRKLNRIPSVSGAPNSIRIQTEINWNVGTSTRQDFCATIFSFFPLIAH